MHDDPKLIDLEERLKKAGAPEGNPEESILDHPEDNSKAGMQAGIEFVSSIALPTAAGIGLDKWLNTSPLFLLLLFFLGLGAGFYNVYRLTNNLGSKVGFRGLQNVPKKDKTGANK